MSQLLKKAYITMRAVVSLAVILAICLGGCQFFQDQDTKSEIREAFTFFGYDPIDSELDYFVEHNTRSISLHEIYNAVLVAGRQVYTQMDGSALRTLYAFQLADALDMLCRENRTDTYQDAGMKYVFGDRTYISTDSKFTPCEAVILISMLLSMGAAAADAWDTSNAVKNAIPRYEEGTSIVYQDSPRSFFSGAKKIGAGALLLYLSIAGISIAGVLGGGVVIVPVIIVSCSLAWFAGTNLGSGLNDLKAALDQSVSVTAYAEYNRATGSYKTSDYMADVSVGAKNITVYPYDSGDMIDGDTIDIKINNVTVTSNLVLVAYPGQAINLTLQSGKNTLTVVAINEGSTPPNTASITFPGGTNRGWNLYMGKSAKLMLDAP